MSITDTESSMAGPSKANRVRGTVSVRNSAQALLIRLHFYAGIFIAPFILIAATTGALYAVSPTLERIVNRDLLHVDSSGAARPLSEQISVAVALEPNLRLVAVAPAPGPGDTTRVIFSDPTLGESERHAVFVDPVTAQPVGSSVVYGSSGALPMRTWIDMLHRDLHLGAPGRLYSEAAASWLWVIALAGLVLWVRRVRGRRSRSSMRWLAWPDRSGSGRSRSASWHATVGVWVIPVLLLLSATGLTWSKYAGENVTEFRSRMSWTTPTIDTALPNSAVPSAAAGEHSHGSTGDLPTTVSADQVAQVDRVYEVAWANGVTGPAEIAFPSTPNHAFSIQERRMSWVYTRNGVAVDGATGTITDRLPYSEWPLAAKLANWGIQLHMGLMFGFVNQLLLVAAMLGLITVIVRGYLMWWRRRPTGRTLALGHPPRRGALRRMPWRIAVPLIVVAVLVGWFVPLIGLSLLGFLMVDVVIGLCSRKRAAT